MNVFDTRLNSPVTSMGELYGRQAAVTALEGKLLSGQQGITLVGPEGSGKTSLLHCFFSTEYRKKMIIEKRRIITAPEPYPTDMTCTEVYYFFREIIVKACALLEACGRDEDYLRLLDALPTGEDQTARGQLSALVDFLHGTLGYSVTLVLDCFEEFTCSPSITHEHHDMLNGLIDRKNLQFVVATNYDMTKVILGTGSYLIQKFGSGVVRLEGLDQDACRKLADDLLAEDDLRLGNGAVRTAQVWSGGNPALLLSFLSQCYERKRAGNSARLDWERDVAEPVYRRTEYLLDHWCRHLDEGEISALLSEILHFDTRPHNITSVVAAALARLQERGLVVRGTSADPGQYDFCCTLLRRYLERSEHSLTPEYLGRQENKPLDILRDGLRNSDFARVKGLLSSLKEQDMPLFLNQLVAHYGTESTVSPEEYHAIGFSLEEVTQMQKRYPREGAMLDDAIRASRIVRLLEDGGSEDLSCDYSMYVYSFGRPCELRLRDVVFPLIDAWPDRGEVRRMLSGEDKELRHADQDSLKPVNYENFLRQAAGKLARVGTALGMDGYDQASAWTAMANDIRVFRRSRNRACHPNDPMSYSEAKHFVQVVYTEHRLFQRLAVCLSAAGYLTKKPDIVR